MLLRQCNMHVRLRKGALNRFYFGSKAAAFPNPLALWGKKGIGGTMRGLAPAALPMALFATPILVLDAIEMQTVIINSLQENWLPVSQEPYYGR
jgi:hypothetical protein